MKEVEFEPTHFHGIKEEKYKLLIKMKTRLGELVRKRQSDSKFEQYRPFCHHNNNPLDNALVFVSFHQLIESNNFLFRDIRTKTLAQNSGPEGPLIPVPNGQVMQSPLTDLSVSSIYFPAGQAVAGCLSPSCQFEIAPQLSG